MRAFRLAYDGTGYRGFQRQPHGETVEDAILEALEALGVGFEDGTPAGYAAAGRTDAGVSARAQTVAFEAPEWLTPRAFNAELPADVRAWASADVPGSFHATHDAVERHYRYFLYAPPSNVEATSPDGAPNGGGDGDGDGGGDGDGDGGGDGDGDGYLYEHGYGYGEGEGIGDEVAVVDDAAVETACERLSGRHDFHNLTPNGSGTEREPTVRVARDGAFLVVDCRAGGFPREFVRRLVSLLRAVGRGERELAFVDRVLDPEPLAGPDGIAPAAPEPLVLLDVAYPGITFEIDASAAAGAREIFERRRRERLAGAYVAGALSPTDDRRIDRG